ncbi:MAG: hypothetical protein JWQ81_8586 [Amycolatopsis sp.]|uniref:hypothetical protein n=1 Tax=Amycolatopsis sp. TaxID=37632 RepID=UPI002604230B|nr:hypothetical protein [Amycolatopsis sp.]MCU1687847.1 hypothetical protein [Amycolatopsis sp.]
MKPTVIPLGEPRCWCCAGITHRVDGEWHARYLGPAVATWTGPIGNVTYLCEHCLSLWFDNADDDEFLEPLRVQWIDGSGRLLDNLVRS